MITVKQNQQTEGEERIPKNDLNEPGVVLFPKLCLELHTFYADIEKEGKK